MSIIPLGAIKFGDRHYRPAGAMQVGDGGVIVSSFRQKEKIMQQLKYLGVPVWMNGQNYYLPSLSTRDFRKFYDTLTAEVDAKDVLGSFDRYIPIIGAAVRRNYPEVTDEQLGEWLDLHTFRLAIKAVQDASGMVAVSAGE